MELPRTLYPLSMVDVLRQGAAAFYALEQRLPTRDELAILASVIGVENARGRAIVQHNWGNLAHVGTTGDWWAPSTIQAGQPQRFQAFPDHASGALAWWRLVRKPRFRAVLAARSAPALVEALYRSGYVAPASEGEQARYTRAAVDLWREAVDRWIPASGLAPRAPWLVAFALGLAGGGVALAQRW